MGRIIYPYRISIEEDILLSGGALENIRYWKIRAGEIITITDSIGNDFRGRVVALKDKEAKVKVFEKFSGYTESSVFMTLLQALPEKERMELIIQKSTELGVNIIVPYKSRRSTSLKEREALQKKSHRWPYIALKASKQCRRATVPEIVKYCGFSRALGYAEGSELKLVLWEKGRDTGIKDIFSNHRVVKSVSLMVGPEGGFTKKEIEKAEDNGFTPIRLGQRILRTETAAIMALGIIQYELGDL